MDLRKDLRSQTILTNRHLDRCSNPFQLEKHYKLRGLRYPSKHLLEKSVTLRETDLLCAPCRKQIDRLDVVDILESAASVGTSQPCSSTSDLSMETKLPVINNALELIGHSPIPKKKLKCSNTQWVENKVAAVAGTLQQTLGVVTEPFVFEDDPWDVRETLVQLKEKFLSPEADKSLKMQILTLLPEHWSIARIAREMNTTIYMARAAKQIFKEKGILSKPDARLGKTQLSRNLKLKIIEFYEDDEISATMPGMKDYVSVRDENGMKSHRQKRLILCNLKELYRLFQTKNLEIKVGFSTFASLRPKHCVLAGSSGTHTVCVCSIHQNMKLMIQGCNLQALTKDLVHHLVDYEDCLQLLVCVDPTSQCYLGDCRECPGDTVLLETMIQALDLNDIDDVKYKQWVLKPRTSLETLIKGASEFAADFCEHANVLLRHSFIAKQQSQFIKTTKNSLEEGQVLVMTDFAENYAFVVQNAAPGFHWNNRQATLYPVVVYYKTAEIIQNKSLIIISDCMHHDSIAVYVFSRVINNFVASLVDNPTKIYYCSDGAPQQFKNYKNFVNLYYHEQDFGVQVEWHFCATAHGKGPCDGIGGTVKRLAARSSLQLPPDQQITTPEELFEWANKPANIPSIAVRYTNVEDYNNAQAMLQERFECAKSIPKTQKLHCIIPASDGKVKTKEYSSQAEYTTHPILKMQK